KAQTASRVCTTSVPSRWKRAGCALRAISGPTASSQAASTSPSAAFGPWRRSSRRNSSPSGSRAHLHELVGLGGKHGGVGRRHERLAGAADAGGEDAPAGRVELGENVIEQQERRDAGALGEQLRLGQEEREPLLALRAEGPEVAPAGEDRDVVQVRAEPGHAAVEVALEARLERGHR